MRAEDLNADFEEKALNHKNYSSTCFKHEQDAGLIYPVGSSSVQMPPLSFYILNLGIAVPTKIQ